MTSRHRSLFRLLVLVAACTAVACGSDSPTAPDPTVTGAWNLSFTEIPVPGVLTLTEASGTVTGGLQIEGEAGTGSLNGTISADGQMVLVGTEPTGSPARLEATVDGARRSFTGVLTLRPEGEEPITLTVTAAKR